MSQVYRVPIIVHDSAKWGALSHITTGSIDVVAEKFNLENSNLSFVGGHRVRLYRLKKNVHFKIPQGTELNISDVPPQQAPRRQQPGQPARGR
jgi:hypothetical protein